MNQSIVTIRLNGQPYQMGCESGSEERIKVLAKNVDSIVQELKGSHGQIGEARLLAMASLIIADKLEILKKEKSSELNIEKIINSIEDVTSEINQLASK